MQCRAKKNLKTCKLVVLKLALFFPRFRGAKREILRGGAERQFGGSGGLPRIFFQIWPLIRAFSDYFWGGAGFARGGRQTILGCQGGGAHPRFPLFLHLCMPKPQ